jgi:hypothetical protein
MASSIAVACYRKKRRLFAAVNHIGTGDSGAKLLDQRPTQNAIGVHPVKAYAVRSLQDDQRLRSDDSDSKAGV